jgi:simple sugar transport system permease protein
VASWASPPSSSALPIRSARRRGAFLPIVGALGIRAQILFGDQIPHDLLLTLPYIATVVGVWISGRLRGGAGAAAAFGELRDY